MVHEADEKACAFWWINDFSTFLKQISCKPQKSMLASLKVSTSPSTLLMSTYGWNWKWSTSGCDLCTFYLITSHLWRKQLKLYVNIILKALFDPNDYSFYSDIIILLMTSWYIDDVTKSLKKTIFNQTTKKAQLKMFSMPKTLGTWQK